jgi:hypothetical protein
MPSPPPRDRREADDDAAKSYAEALRSIRERHIRRHAVLPRPGDPEELRWWDEGERAR